MERRTALLLAAPVLAVGLAIAPAAAALAATTGASATATAKGSNEVGKVGDPKATAMALFTFDTSSHQLCYTVTATSLQAVAMHIHKGAAVVNGPVVVPLDPTKIGAGKACVAVAPALLSDISSNPAGYYFNAHTKAFPAGAVRGQLVSAPALVSTPTGVAAGNGGQAEGSTSALPVLLMLAGGAVVGTAGWRLLPRRRS
jgi:hypothetical protein